MFTWLSDITEIFSLFAFCYLVDTFLGGAIKILICWTVYGVLYTFFCQIVIMLPFEADYRVLNAFFDCVIIVLIYRANNGLLLTFLSCSIIEIVGFTMINLHTGLNRWIICHILWANRLSYAFLQNGVIYRSIWTQTIIFTNLGCRIIDSSCWARNIRNAFL